MEISIAVFFYLFMVLPRDHVQLMDRDWQFDRHRQG